jgi:hypothetical protein
MFTTVRTRQECIAALSVSHDYYNEGEDDAVSEIRPLPILRFPTGRAYLSIYIAHSGEHTHARILTCTLMGQASPRT